MPELRSVWPDGRVPILHNRRWEYLRRLHLMFEYDDTLVDQFHGPLIERTVAALVGPNGAQMVTAARAQSIVARAVHQARNRGAAELAFDLMPVSYVALALGVSPRRVQQLHRSRGVGERYGREILFRRRDVEALRERVRTPGRPRKGADQ